MPDTCFRGQESCLSKMSLLPRCFPKYRLTFSLASP
jgi:hypothetical protein